MSKSVLISIQPKWCELILRGKKTLEVRKSRPKVKTPFKCYIYCTYGDALIEHSDMIHPDHLAECIKVSKNKIWDNCRNGKVIGEFLCDDIIGIVRVGCTMRETLQYRAVKNGTLLSDDIFNYTYLSKKEIEKYLDGRKGYAWHISNLVIYDKPKELSEFTTKCNKNCETGCYDCEYYHFEAFESAMGVMECCRVDGLKPLKRPPQSWCYVKECEENA